MLTAINSGTISFGFVSIPFKLFTAQGPKSVDFNTLHVNCGARLRTQLRCPSCNVVVERGDQKRGAGVSTKPRRGMTRLHRACGSPLKEQLFCPVHDEVVERADSTLAFQHCTDSYAHFSDEELKSLESPRTGRLDIQEFVPANTLDALYVKRTYFIGPDDGADRAYRLLAHTLNIRGLIGIGRFARRGREDLVAIRHYRKGIVLQELFYADEVRSFDDVDTGAEFDFKPLELDLAENLIKQKLRPGFDAGRFRNEWAERVLAAVNNKIAGEQIERAPARPNAKVIDLLAALRRRQSQPANETVGHADATAEE